VQAFELYTLLYTWIVLWKMNMNFDGWLTICLKKMQSQIFKQLHYYAIPCTRESISCLINAQPLPAHRPASDDNGCTGHDLRDDWSLSSAHIVDSWCPFRRSFECILLLNQMFWKQCIVCQYHSDLADQSALEIRIRIWVRLRVALF